MKNRPHLAHTGQPQSTNVSTAHGAPSQVLDPESDHVRSLLEELDDVIFLAIRGDADSLNRAQQLWPKVVEEIGWEFVEESREQYLRYSTDIASGFQHDEKRDPARVMAAIEVIELLMRD